MSNKKEHDILAIRLAQILTMFSVGRRLAIQGLSL